MNIIDHILKHTTYKSNISLKDDSYNPLFSTVSLESWPIANVVPNMKIEYLQAYLHPDKFCLSQEFNLDTKFSVADYSYTLSEQFHLDDILTVHISSLIRQGKSSETKDNFVYNLIKKHLIFLKNFAKNAQIPESDVKMTIYAHSGDVEGTETRGGYVWATQGFCFESEEELNCARKAFKKFAVKYGVNIADKDLKYFKYPCHFAAFEIDDSNNLKELGKQFLLQYSWKGVLSGSLNEKSEPLLYQKYYHEEGKDAAKSVLSKSFLAVVNKYNHHHRKNVSTNILQKGKSLLNFQI